MKNSFSFSLKSIISLLLLFLFVSCATYNTKIASYYDQFTKGNYKTAEEYLNKNKWLQKPRNRLLYLMEKGKISHLQSNYQQSNSYLNQADSLIELNKKGIADYGVGILVNPMTQFYEGEDFEKFMIHYYKALNYIYLKNKEDALVEIRKISLASNAQEQKYRNENRYTKDVFSLILQALVYESDNDINNAFIASRNAVEAYLKNKNKSYYGTVLPETLKKDLLRLAYLNGFQSELEYFEKQFAMKYERTQQSEGGELIFLWENGLAPIKVQEDYFFTLVSGDSGSLFFTNALGIPIPFNYSGKSFDVKSIETITASFPKYVTNTPTFTSAILSNEQKGVSLEKIENINELAIKTLKERFLKEMTQTLTRIATKKIAEYGLVSLAKNNQNISDGLSTAIKVYSLVSEKADTRNWQSLPSSISYARIPLKKGTNTLQFKMKNERSGKEEIKNFVIQGTGTIQFYTQASLY